MKLREKMKRFWTLDVHNHEGFTLVELIIVIAILAILSTGAIAGYSAYVEKAKEAADMNLLSAYNTAINAACSVNGVPVDRMQGAVVKLNNDGSFSDLTNIPDLSVARSSSNGLNNKVKADFLIYLGDNATITFQFYGKLVFNNGAFEGIPADEVESVTITTSNGITVTINKIDKDNFNGSIFSTGMNSDILLGKVNDVTGLAAEMLGSSTRLQEVLGLTDGSAAVRLAASMGFDLVNNAEVDGPKFTAAVNDILAKRAAILVAANPEKYAGQSITDNESQLYIDCYNQVVANNAVMDAATNAQAASKNIFAILTDTTKDPSVVIAQNMATGEGMSQAAMAYGLYTAYAQREGLTVSDDPSEVLDALNTQDFRDYVNNVDGGENEYEADLAGYMAAMNMITSNKGTDIVDNVLVNGFNSADLLELLNQAKAQE